MEAKSLGKKTKTNFTTNFIRNFTTNFNEKKQPVKHKISIFYSICINDYSIIDSCYYLLLSVIKY